MPHTRIRTLARAAGSRVPSPPAAEPQAFQNRRDVNVERLNRADRLIAMSGRVAEIYSLLGVDRSKISTIELTLRRIEGLRPRRRKGEVPVMFATVAGLSSHAKGSRLLVEAVRLLSDSVPAGSFKLVALGGVDPGVAAEVDRLREIEVGAPGPFSDNQLDAVLDEVDVGIVPSIWEEAYGFVGPEFLAKGIPVIANAIGGMPEYTRDGETGWLNHSCSAPELARIMREIVERPEQVATLNEKILAARDKHHQAHGPPRGRDRSGLPRALRVKSPGEGEEARRLEAEPFAWVLVVVLGALGLAAGLALAPPLGELFEPAPLETWPDDAVRALISPEPTELARFAIAVLAPLIAVAVLIFARDPGQGYGHRGPFAPRPPPAF